MTGNENKDFLLRDLEDIAEKANQFQENGAKKSIKLLKL